MNRLPVPDPKLQRLVTEIERGFREAQTSFDQLPPEFADDTAAAAGGLEIGDRYRTGSVTKVRVA
jgi:hypothetical protein